jgi:hypothetical protein
LLQNTPNQYLSRKRGAEDEADAQNPHVENYRRVRVLVFPIKIRKVLNIFEEINITFHY